MLLLTHHQTNCNLTSFTSRNDRLALPLCSTACSQCLLVHTCSSTRAKGSWSDQVWGTEQSSLWCGAPDSDHSCTTLSAEQSTCAPKCLPLPCCFLQACRYTKVYMSFAPLGKAVCLLPRLFRITYEAR